MEAKIKMSLLPEYAQKELLDFYEFLLNKYAKVTASSQLKKQTDIEIDQFFNAYNLDLKDFSFNRNEIYER